MLRDRGGTVFALTQMHRPTLSSCNNSLIVDSIEGNCSRFVRTGSLPQSNRSDPQMSHPLPSSEIEGSLYCRMSFLFSKTFKPLRSLYFFCATFIIAGL